MAIRRLDLAIGRDPGEVLDLKIFRKRPQPLRRSNSFMKATRASTA
jgi:hypothetical protein